LFDAQSNEELPEQEYMKADDNDEDEDHDNEIWPNRQLSPTFLYKSLDLGECMNMNGQKHSRIDKNLEGDGDEVAEETLIGV
jgi:hypothetical protein